LSEETEDDHHRLTRSRVWIVDPIDGTRSFVRGLPEFCLSVALVEHGIPAIAAIFNPATGEFFSAIRGQGIRVERQAEAGQAPFTPIERPLALVNSWELRIGRFQTLKSHLHCRPIGSIAYALALVAAGQADAAVTLEGGNEWDIAAGVLLIEESGGRATTAAGHPYHLQPRRPQGEGYLGHRHGPDLTGTQPPCSTQCRTERWSRSSVLTLFNRRVFSVRCPDRVHNGGFS
jgi:myo-inositol-1(or 4)-monophosphatase